MLGSFKLMNKNSNEDNSNTLLLQGQKVENVKFLQNGSIHIYLSLQDLSENPPENLLEDSYKVLTLESNEFLVGLTDLLYSGEYSFSYMLSKTGINLNHTITENNEIKFAPNKVYEDISTEVYSAASLINSLYISFTELVEFNDELDKFISCSSVYYWFFKEAHNISRAPRTNVLLEGVKKYQLLKSKNIKLSYGFSPESFEEYQNIGFDFCIPSNESFNASKIRYFQCLCDIDRDVMKSFMTSNAYFPNYHCIEAAHTIHQLKESFNNEFSRSKQLLAQIFSNSEDAIITELIRAFIEAKQNNMNASGILDLIDYITDKYKESIMYFEEKYDVSLGVNFNKLNILLSSIRPNSSSNTSIETSSSEHIPVELSGCLDRILEFSNLDPDKIDFFKSLIKIFKKMENKDKIDLVPADSRNKFNSIFLEIYEAVLNRVFKENVHDRAIDMFLVYGFMDDELLTNQQILGLNTLLDMYADDGNIYSSKRWFTKIYNKEKSPSITDMGLDYELSLKDKKAKGLSSGSSANENYDSGEHRVNFEIMNMFKTNHKLCYGQISTYFPILHNETMPNDISKVAVTIKKINESLLNILNEDFSAFHREVFYTGDNLNFKKELIMKQVIPDIILMPTIGTKAIMWQEITGRSRLSPGRLILPILTSEDLNNLMTKLTSNFRWELCRTVMGARWNDFSYKSLTSEYADYIQEYKKNKNLSPEIREKVKIQIQRHHNNLREIFSSDYDSWIKYEAKGIRKVNKEARAILYKYCPFKQSMRQELLKQPAFSEIATQFENERKKFVREMENRYAYYVKHRQILEPELEENLRFYKEL